MTANASRLRIAVPDLISNSYFPVIAAAELGCFKREGLDVGLELVVPVENALASRTAASSFSAVRHTLSSAGSPSGMARSFSVPSRRACTGFW